MGFLSWLRGLFGRRSEKVPTVPYWDATSKRVIRIPKAELAPGAIQARMEGQQELVWLLPEDLQQGGHLHPPFQEDVLLYIRRIQSTFAEHRPISVEEWEDGFRRDANPTQEIALWIYSAEIYEEFTQGETLAARRADVWRVLVACLTTSSEGVYDVLRTSALSREEAERIVRRYFQKP